MVSGTYVRVIALQFRKRLGLLDQVRGNQIRKMECVARG